MNLVATPLGFSPPAASGYYLGYSAPSRSGPLSYIDTGTGSGAFSNSSNSWGSSYTGICAWAPQYGQLTSIGVIPPLEPSTVTFNNVLVSPGAVGGGVLPGSAAYARVGSTDVVTGVASLNTNDGLLDPSGSVCERQSTNVVLLINDATVYNNVGYTTNGQATEIDGGGGTNLVNYLVANNGYTGAWYEGDAQGAGLYASWVDTNAGVKIVTTGFVTSFTGWGPVSTGGNGWIAGYGIADLLTGAVSDLASAPLTGITGPMIAESDISSHLFQTALSSQYYTAGAGGFSAAGNITDFGIGAGEGGIAATLFNGKWLLATINLSTFHGVLYQTPGDTFSGATPVALSSTDPALAFMASGYIVWALWNEGGTLYAVIGDTGLSTFVATSLGPASTAAPYTNYPLPPVLPAACIPACGQ
jgi:hypothetical protein